MYVIRAQQTVFKQHVQYEYTHKAHRHSCIRYALGAGRGGDGCCGSAGSSFRGGPASRLDMVSEAYCDHLQLQSVAVGKSFAGDRAEIAGCRVQVWLFGGATTWRVVRMTAIDTHVHPYVSAINFINHRRARVTWERNRRRAFHIGFNAARRARRERTTDASPRPASWIPTDQLHHRSLPAWFVASNPTAMAPTSQICW